MNNKKPVRRSWFKMRLRGQQVVLFLLVSLTPLLIVALTIKMIGDKALRSSVGDGLVQLARGKLFRIDRAISEKIGRIRAEFPNMRSAIADANRANRNLSVFTDVNERLEDSLRLLESYAGRRRGYRTEVTITNLEGDVIASNKRDLDFNPRRNSSDMIKNVKLETWWKKTYNNGSAKSYIENVRYDPEQRVYLLPASLPIYNRGRRPPPISGNRSSNSNRDNRKKRAK